jgi:DNA-directed RNA polymerase subunit beta'
MPDSEYHITPWWEEPLTDRSHIQPAKPVMPEAASKEKQKTEIPTSKILTPPRILVPQRTLLRQPAISTGVSWFAYAGQVKVAKNLITLSYEGPRVHEHVIPMGYKIYPKNGDMVEKGDRLTDGSIHLQELFELKGRPAVQRYILEEVQNIYSSQGQKVNDKHVELIIRQMFSRVYVEDAGDTELLPGEIVEKAQLELGNRATKKTGGKLAIGRELLLGVSRVALSTQSFLSAASFQETARVLINTATTGKIDYLDGLKENVIIGRLIPVGTGYHQIEGTK